MKRRFFIYLVAAAVIVHCRSSLSSAQEPSLAEYTNFPVFVTSSVVPNIMIILDNSGSMNEPAYAHTEEYQGGTGCMVNVRIKESSDDAYERLSDQKMSYSGLDSRTDTSLPMITKCYKSSCTGTNKAEVMVGLRFQGVTVPPGVTIKTAYIEFTAKDTNSETTSLQLYVQDHDNPSGFSSSDGDISGRTYYPTPVHWNNVGSWTKNTVTNARTPELKSLIQQIVNRPGWASGNSIVFKITGTSGSKRVAKSFNESSTECPVLHIEYEPCTGKKYFGYFNPDARYTYSSNKFVPDPSGNWSGNFLNWLAMRKIDVLRKVLMGGLSTARTGGGATVNYGEPAAAPTRDYYVTCDATGVSPYSGTTTFKLSKGNIVVGSTTYTIAVQKVEADEPEDFYEGQLAGVLQKVGTKARWGNMWFNYGTGTNESGGTVAAPIRTRNASAMNALADALQNKSCNTWTPLAETFYVCMHYFMQVDVPSGWDYPNNAIGPINNQNDPYMDGDEVIDCAKSFVIILTDGMSTKDQKVPDEAFNGKSLRDYDQDGRDPGNYPDQGTDYLDDLALYAHTTDLRPPGPKNLDGIQNLTVYTIYAFGGDPQAERLLKDTAINGGFEDINGNNLPDLQQEWDANGDGEPDNFFKANDGYQLRDKLLEVINAILQKAASGTAVSVLATTGEGEGTVVQAYFRPSLPSATTNVKWIGYLQSLWVDGRGNIREDTINDYRLDITRDKIIKFYFDNQTGEAKVERYAVTASDPYLDTTSPQPEYITLEDLTPIWEAGNLLADRSESERHIYTYVGSGGTLASPDAFDNTGDCIEFTVQNAARIKPFLGVHDTAMNDWRYLGDTEDNRVKNLIRFIRGVEDGSTEYEGSPTIRERTVGGKLWKLSDIVYSTPVSIAKPVEKYHLIYDDQTYWSFYRKYGDNETTKRETVIYVGSNGGMLHAFTSGIYDPANKSFDKKQGTVERIGDELWAYIPRALLPHLKWLPRTDYTHVPYVDLKPKVIDAQVFTSDSTHPYGWGTILIGGMNLGGKRIPVPGASGTQYYSSSYFAIDITDPRQPRLLWDRWYDNLGLTINQPSVIKVHDNWYLVIGSGFDDYDGSVTHKGRIYIVDLKTGEPLKYFETPETLAYCNTPIGLDKSLNYSVDAIYAGVSYNSGGTWKGKAYKIAVPVLNSPYSEGLDVTYDTNPANWKFTQLFSDTNLPPISAPFTVSVDYMTDAVWVYLGTGRYLVNADKTSSEQNYILGIKDPFYNRRGTYEGAANTPTCFHNYNGCSLSFSDLFWGDPYKIKPDGSVEPSAGGIATITSFDKLIQEINKKDATGRETYQGWYKKLALTTPSERVVNKPTVIGGIAIFPTFTPNESVCGFGGSSRLFAVYYTTGTAYRKAVLTNLDNTAEIQYVMDLGYGLSSSFAVHAGKETGGAITVYGQQSTGVITEIEIMPAISVKSGMQFWKEGRE